MTEFKLEAQSPLQGTDQWIGSIHIREAVGLGLISLAVPQGGVNNLNQDLKKAIGFELPEIGKSVLAENTRIIRLGIDQAFALFDNDQPTEMSEFRQKMSGSAYMTDQSDSWVAIELGGRDVHQALERVCMLNLNPEKFTIGDVARTMMEHLGVVIIRTGDDQFLMMSASSSAASFLHMVEVSARNVA